MKRLFLACLALICACQVSLAQTSPLMGPLQQILADNRALIEKSSRTTIGPVIDAIAASDLPQARGFLEAWQNKNVWQRKEDGLFFIAEEVAKRSYALRSPDDGAMAGEYAKDDLKQLKPNSGIRALIATALVQFQLSDPDPAIRAEALLAIERAPGADLLAPLRASIPKEKDAALKARKMRLAQLLTIAYGADDAERIKAIEGLSGDLGVDVRAALNPLVATTVEFGETLPQGRNIARTLTPGQDGLSRNDAYDMLVAAGHVPARTTPEALRQGLAENIQRGRVAGVSLAQLSD